MTYDDEANLCIACTAYLSHYPVMVGHWECGHTDDETAFMLALADAIHGPTPEGEFTDPGWRAAQFLDDADLASSVGSAPYLVTPAPDALARGFTFLALVNDDYLIGARVSNGDPEDLDLIARVGGWLTHVPAEEEQR